MIAPSDSTKFVIVGTQRSGTTWIRTTLDSHPSITALGELFLFGRRFPRLTGTGKEIEASYRNYIGDSARLRMHDLISRQSAVERFLDETYANHGPGAIGFKFMRSHSRQFPSVVPYILKHKVAVLQVTRENVLKTLVSRETAKRRKLFHTRSAVPNIQLTLDTSALVPSLEEIATDNAELAKTFSVSRYMRVTYEDFVRNKDAELQKIYDFLCVDSVNDVSSQLRKINPDRLSDIITNYNEVTAALRNTPFSFCTEQ